MMLNFWQNLAKQKQPFFALAPLDDVTDTVFRQIVAGCAPPDVFFTEFANAEGFCSPGKESIERRLRFTEAEHPLVAQIWGKDPEHYYKMAKELAARGFVGIDINMGCPEKTVVRSGQCSALIENHELAASIIEATKKGAGKVPVSVKTRIGFDTIATEDWIGFLLTQGLAAITVHGRTKKEMSKVSAHWDEIKKAVKLRDKIAPCTVMIGNGDVMSLGQGRKLAAESGVDGVMIGRGIFHNPFVFEEPHKEHTTAEYLEVLKRHLELHAKTWDGQKSYQPLKKFFKIYVKDFPGAVQLRATLMQTNTHTEALEAIREFQPNSVV